MLYLVITLSGAVFVMGIAYLGIILWYAVKVRKSSCNGRVRLEEADYEKAEYADIYFIEEVSNKLHNAGYRWLGDYKVKGLRGQPIKVCATDPAEMTYYARYFIDEIKGIIGTICYCCICEEENKQLIYKKQHYVTVFYLETSFLGGKHIISSMMSPKQFEGRKLLNRMQYPAKEQHYYKSVQETDEMIQEHEMWAGMLKETMIVDPVILRWKLEDILTYWNRQAYSRDKKHFKYLIREKCFIPTLTYAVHLVANRPFLSLLKK